MRVSGIQARKMCPESIRGIHPVENACVRNPVGNPVPLAACPKTLESYYAGITASTPRHRRSLSLLEPGVGQCQRRRLDSTLNSM